MKRLAVGELVDFDEGFSQPKPVRKPHPPIHAGGAAPWGIRRALRHRDGWIPLPGRGDTDLIDDMGHLPHDGRRGRA